MRSAEPQPASRRCRECTHLFDGLARDLRRGLLGFDQTGVNNVKLYPKFQEYFRTAKPPLLAVWGKFDPYFIPAGAEAFRRDNPNAVVQLLPTGHFALETHLEEVVMSIRKFLADYMI